MNKKLNIIAGAIVVLILLYFSVDVKKLDEYKLSNRVEIFDAAVYAGDVWENKIPVIAKQAPAIGLLLDLLENNPEQAFSEYGKKLGISKTWHFMAKGSGTIDSVDEESVWVNLENDGRIQLATSFIFGNTVREGSGAVNIDDFVNMTDFNNVSVALNKMVKKDIIPLIKNNSTPGRQVDFAGAFEFNEESGKLTNIRVIPVSVTIKNAE